MPIYLGTTPLDKAYVGTAGVEKIYLGTEVLWQNIVRVVDEPFTYDSSLNLQTANPLWLKRMNFATDNFRSSSSNQIYRTGSGATDSSDGNDAYIYDVALSQTQTAYLDIVAVSSGNPGPGLVVRTGRTSGTGILGQITNTGWRLFISTPGTGNSRTTIASASTTMLAGYRAALSIDASNNVEFKYGDTVLWSGVVANAPTGAYAGFSAGKNSQRSDNFSLEHKP